MMVVMFRMLCVGFLLSFLPKGCSSQLSVCGVASLNNKIVGGQTATAGFWPWQVSLRLTAYNFHFCGGSLINNGWVLTAAHCFRRVTASQISVYLGAETLKGTNTNQISRTVKSVTINPNYDPYTQDNDLALLQLSSTVTFTPYITPVCLADFNSTFFNGTLSWVTGWGNIAENVSLPSPGNLQEVQVPIIGNMHCNCLYTGSITDNMICAGALPGGKDSCQGDSGGPLVVKQGSVWIQAGIVSFGNGCAEANFPGVYTRVSQYQPWINQVITSNQPGFITYTSNGTSEDLSVFCTLPPAKTAVPTTPPVVCGNANLNNPSGAVTGLASAGMWPWMASVQRNGTHVCGGTLISTQFVMSSADCFSGSTNTSGWTVVLGRLMQNGNNANEVSIKVANITFSNTSQNSIAVLQLAGTATLSNYIQPICVDQGSNNFAVNTQCWAAGWGSGGGAQQTLQQFSTSVVSCDSGSASTSICTDVFPLEQSERGGPLMCQVGTSWFQAAVLTMQNSTANSSITSSNSTISSNSNNSSSNSNNSSSNNSTNFNNSSSSNSTSSNSSSSTSSTNSTTSNSTSSTSSTNSTTSNSTSSTSSTNSTTSNSTSSTSSTSSNSTSSNNSTNSTSSNSTSSTSSTNSTTSNSTSSTSSTNSTTSNSTSSTSSTNSTTSNSTSSTSSTSSNSTSSTSSTNSTTSNSTSSTSSTSSNNSINSNPSKSLQLDVAAQNSNQMIFSKTSDFTSFLRSTVGSLPSNTASTLTITSKPGSGTQLFLSVTSVLLLSLPGIIHVLG